MASQLGDEPVREMEGDTVNRKLAIIEALRRPDFGCDMGQWRQRWKRWVREVKTLPTASWLSIDGRHEDFCCETASAGGLAEASQVQRDGLW